MDEDEPSLPDTIIECRENFIVSPSSGNSIMRASYFLKPCSKQDILPPPHFPKTANNSLKSVLEVRYNGWRMPNEEWKSWVRKLSPKYEYLWIQAGNDIAIKASTYEIKRDDELKTNTFVFPWGEATVTLEDISVCFGYSILGDYVCSTLVNKEQNEVAEEVVEARKMFNSSKARKVAQHPWRIHFMENESKVELEAFLVYWLSRFVFPGPAFDTISKSVNPLPYI